MKRKIQGLLLATYRCALATGILSTRLGSATFEFAYLKYKALFEAGEVNLLRGYVAEGGTVIDVGANIGFFTLNFAAWVGASGQVFAIEPAQDNLERLSYRIKRHGYTQRIILIHAAAADKFGELRLAMNPVNPMDHRLSESGTPVKAITIDGLCELNDWPPVCLIKIDVQGAEGRVIAGAIETIKRFGPALFVEIEDTSVSDYSPGALFLDELTSLGYWPYILRKKGAERVQDINAAITIVKMNGYADFLFLKFKDVR